MTRQNPGRLQSYVLRGGEQVFAPPYVMANTGLHIFVVEASMASLVEVVDREINDPWSEAFLTRGILHHFTPTYNWLAFVFADVKGLRPLSPTLPTPAGLAPDATTNVLLNTSAHQRELVIMLPITDDYVRPGLAQGLSSNSSIFYLPYVFNDFPPSIAAGREVYGYPKQYGTFSVTSWRGRRRPFFGEEPKWKRLTMQAYGPSPVEPSPDQTPYALELADFLVIERGKQLTAGAQLSAEGITHPRIEYETVQPPDGAIEIIPESTDRWTVPAVRAPQRACPVAPADVPPDAMNPTRNALQECRELLRKPMEYLFLRQFRDPSQTNKASYQAVVTGSIVPTRERKEYLWEGASQQDVNPYTISFPTLAKGEVRNPISFTLGLPRESNAEALRLPNLSITVNAASIIWDRS